MFTPVSAALAVTTLVTVGLGPYMKSSLLVLVFVPCWVVTLTSTVWGLRISALLGIVQVILVGDSTMKDRQSIPPTFTPPPVPPPSPPIGITS